MPPPTAGDSWLSGRRFGVVIDAGSSGSRLQLYSWRDAGLVREQEGEAVYNRLPKIEKGTKDEAEWITKIEPGLSSFADNLDGIANYLAPLLEQARENVPPSLQNQTPLFLLATAGMRLLSPPQQAQILSTACDFLRFHSHFRIDAPSAAGPCGSSVRIITGEEEGVFGWIAVNYLMDGFSDSEEGTTYGFLDMGGASTQIAFEPSKIEAEKTRNLLDIRLRLLGGQEIVHKVFTTTWLGYGTNQARERYVSSMVSASEVLSYSETPIQDPCLPKGLQLRESAFVSRSSNEPPHLRGTGSFEECLRRVGPLLNKDAPCPDAHCLFNGVYVPPIDFAASHFIGVSEYWYSSEHVFGLGGPYDFVQYERAASSFCSQDWADILESHKHSQTNGHLGGDGEVEENGKVIGAGVWGDDVEVSRLEMQCFKAAWIVNVLHDGLGMPRLVDPGGNATEGEPVRQEANEKGLGKPTFQSVDAIDGTAISWALGKIVLEASNQVPPLVPATPPLADPLDGVAASSPIQPIRPPFWNLDNFKDHIADHLPIVLSGQSLGLSPTVRMFYLLLFGLLAWMLYRLRHHVWPFIRTLRSHRSVTEAMSMEEGGTRSFTSPSPSRSTSPSRSLSRALVGRGPLRRLASFVRTRTKDQNPPHRPRLFTSPGGSFQQSLSNPRAVGGSYPSDNLFASDPPSSQSRSASPSIYEDPLNLPNASGTLSTLSRSRNSSMLNLSTLVTRPASRNLSGAEKLEDGSFFDER